MAAGIAPKPTITMPVAAGSKEVKGGGLLGSGKRKALNITTTIYVTVKNGETVIEEASTKIEPRKSATVWTVTLQNALIAGQTVYVKQKCNDDISDEVSATVTETMASKYKTKLQMPSGDFYLEEYTANIPSDDEEAEALEILKAANKSIASDIKSVEFKITGETTKTASYIVTYTDDSKSEEIKAPNLQIVKVTEYSRKYILEPYNVMSTVIKGKLAGKAPFDNVKVQYSPKLSGAAKKNFGVGGSCAIDKNSTDFQPIDVNTQTGEFSINVGDTLELGKVLGIVVKERHKFASCSSTVPEIAMPKITDVKDPKKIKPEEKEKIAQAIRDANTTTSGKSKLPNGTGYDRGGIPAYIEITDDGKVKVISPNNVDGKWDSNLNKFVPETNQDGTVKVRNGKESSTIELNDPKKLVKNVAPDAPKLENKGGNVTITPNIKVDTDAQTVEVEYEDPQGNTNKVTATKTATGWTVDNNKAKVDKNGVVTIPTKEIKNGSTVKAVVIDRDGLPATDPTTPSGKAELKIENKYKVTYDSNGGTGTMPEEEVNVGSKYRILENQFTPPAEKEFDKWMIGFEPKNPGEDTEVNNDIVIKAIWKYIINPTASEVETIVGHPVDYDMYKKAIKDFPADLKVEHIEVKEAPDISKVGGTQAEISVRFSDGQFRTIPVTVNVKPDPKDKEIEKLNNDIKGLNKQITDLNNKIAEKDGKITELNGKITELEKQLKACQEQCAADKAQCEKAKKALQEQINTLAKEKSNLEIQVKENRELIEQLRSQITDLKQQVEDWKKIAGEKDTKIKELENNIKELNTKLETANTANTELKEKLATANQKITDLEAKVKELEGKVTELEGKIKELGNTIKSKDAEIKTLNETIATLKEKVATLETEKTKDKEQYEKDKTALQEKLDKANADLTAKNAELDKIKAELEQAKKDLADEKAKTAGLTEKTKAQEEKIAGLEEQLKALQDKLNKADTDLKAANARILELEKQLTEKETENKALTEQVEKLGKDLETKTTEVNNLNSRIVELEKQVSEKTAQGVADKAEIERLKAELEELKGKLKTKSDEADKLSKEIVTLKETVKTLEGEKTELTNNVTRLEKEVTTLKETIKTSTEKITELEKENSRLTESNKNLTEKVTELTDKVKKAEDENKTLKTKIDELNAKITELSKTQCDPEEVNKLKEEKAALEATVKGKDALIQELRNQITDLKKSISDKDTLIKEYKEKIEKLEAKVNELTTENTNLKENLATATERITNLEKQLTDALAKNKELEKQNKALTQEKEDLTEAKNKLADDLKKSEDEKAKLQGEKVALEQQVAKLQEELAKCPADSTDKIKELEKQIAEKEDQIKEKDKSIGEKDKEILNLTSKIVELNNRISELLEKIKRLENQPREKEYIKEYIYVRDNYTPSYNGDVYSLNLEIEALRRENRELKDKIAKLSQGQDCSLMAKERFVTIFSLKSMLYKTYLGDELMTQAEMMDLKGFIEPFISNNRTMLPLRYVALSLGLDVDWNHSTRTATFTNRDSSNALNPGKITINANTLEMKDQYGNKIAVDSKPMLKNGRFYISITNLTKAFGGTNGNLADGVRNTIEWDSQGRRVLVYKYSK